MALLKRGVVLLVATSLAGCGATLTQLRTRAAVDLGCDASAIRVDAIDGATEIASGCGKRAVYVEIFNNSRYPAWLLNSQVEPASPVAAPPPLQSMR